MDVAKEVQEAIEREGDAAVQSLKEILGGTLEKLKPQDLRAVARVSRKLAEVTVLQRRGLKPKRHYELAVRATWSRWVATSTTLSGEVVNGVADAILKVAERLGATALGIAKRAILG